MISRCISSWIQDIKIFISCIYILFVVEIIVYHILLLFYIETIGYRNNWIR